MDVNTYVAHDRSLKVLQKQLATGRARLQFLLYAVENAKAEVKQQQEAVTCLEKQVEEQQARQASALLVLGFTSSTSAALSTAFPAPGPQ